MFFPRSFQRSLALATVFQLVSTVTAFGPKKNPAFATLKVHTNASISDEQVSDSIDSVPDAKDCPPGEPYPPPSVEVPPGWEGGFAESNPDFAYPVRKPDLSSIKVTTNLANIDKLTRQMKVEWPEFSWQMEPGDNTSRCFVKFAEYISRYGYDDEGKVWSLICPQQGVKLSSLGEINIEVTVTGVRGYVNEPGRSVAVDLGVKGQIWFTGDKDAMPLLEALASFLAKYKEYAFPFTKSKAIKVLTNEVGNPRQPLFRNADGMCKDFLSPPFTQHWDEAYMVSHLSVQIGKIENTTDYYEGSEIVSDFNQMILDIFNVGSGNMLQNNNILTWNIWAKPPELVNQTEWKDHAQKWRDSFDVSHTYPIGIGKRGKTFLYDGQEVKSTLSDAKFREMEIFKLKEFFKKHCDRKTLVERIEDSLDPFTKAHHDVLKDLGIIEDMF